MRSELFYNPRLLIERLAEISLDARRKRRLRGTPAAHFQGALLDSLELLELIPRPPTVIFDVGANAGTWTTLARSVYPNAKIIAFEPLDWHCEEFSKLNRGVSRVTLHQIALGKEPGLFQMHVPTQSDSASLLPMAEACTTVFNLKFDKNIEVQVARLDDYVEERKIPKPDLIKLDVQGFEYEVLCGGPKVLDHATAVIIEASFKEFYVGQRRFDELLTILARAGFFLHAFGARTALAKPMDQCDVLLLRAT
jgi:FkbM family methyltransferase